jgi:hypothetical protein
VGLALPLSNAALAQINNPSSVSEVSPISLSATAPETVIYGPMITDPDTEGASTAGLPIISDSG